MTILKMEELVAAALKGRNDGLSLFAIDVTEELWALQLTGPGKWAQVNIDRQGDNTEEEVIERIRRVLAAALPERWRITKRIG